MMQALRRYLCKLRGGHPWRHVDVTVDGLFNYRCERCGTELHTKKPLRDVTLFPPGIFRTW